MRSSCRSPLCFLALSSSNICLALEVVTNVLHRCYQPEFPLVLMMEDGITNSEGSWLNVVFRLLCISCIDYRQLLRDLQFKDPFALLCHACSTSPDTDTSLGIFIQTWWRDFSVVPPQPNFYFWPSWQILSSKPENVIRQMGPTQAVSAEIHSDCHPPL